jgi:hypothetical protein
MVRSRALSIFSMENKMAFEQRDNSGSLWVNDRKSEENHPDRTGTVMVDGRLYFCNGWLKKTKDGKPYLSLSFKPKDERATKNSKHRASADDEIF